MTPFRLVIGFVVALLACTGQDALAYFKVCNKRASTMWVSVGNYQAKVTKILNGCNVAQVANGSSCYYTAWKVTGWWQVSAGQCATVLGGALTNRWVYVRAQFADGNVLQGNVTFNVQNPAFSWDEQATLKGSGCVVGTGIADGCSVQPYAAGFYGVDTGSFTDFTFNIR